MTHHRNGDTHAIWQVVLGMGAVVLAVVIVLMMLLLSLIKDIRGKRRHAAGASHRCWPSRRRTSRS